MSFSPKRRERLIRFIMKHRGNKKTLAEIESMPTQKLVDYVCRLTHVPTMEERKEIESRPVTAAQARKERAAMLERRIEKRRLKKLREQEALAKQPKPKPILVKKAK